MNLQKALSGTALNRLTGTLINSKRSFGSRLFCRRPALRAIDMRQSRGGARGISIGYRAGEASIGLSFSSAPRRAGLQVIWERMMQTAPEIEFQGLKANPQVQDAIMKRLGELESRWGRITACRVVLKAPGQRHQSGGLYEVHIRLALPDGREVNVGRTPPNDERHADLTFAINDAFKHARRQLQDQARRMQGQTKHHEAPVIGTIVRLDPSAEFGFIESSGGQEVYFHRNSVLNNGFARLRVGSRVTFAEEMGEQGPQASTVRLVGKHGLRIQ